MTLQAPVQAPPLRAEAPTLVIVPPGAAAGDGGISPATPLLGMPLLRRTVLAAERAGFGRIVVVCRDPAAMQPLLEGTPAVAAGVGQPLPLLLLVPV